MTEGDDKRPYVGGVRKAMLLLGAAPIALVTWPAYWVLWGPWIAAGHTLFWLLLAAFLTELLLTTFHKVPFTCSYVPGRANVKLFWPAYALAVTTYAYASARLELWLFENPTRWAAACSVALAAAAALMTYRRFTLRVPPPLIYDEPVEPAVQVLHLMRPV